MNKAIRFALVLLFAALSSAPLGAETRLATANPSVNAVETVDWSAGVPYKYDGSGNIRQIGNDYFVYDKAGRLVEAEVNAAVRKYTYDAFGNRKTCQQNPGTPLATDCQYAVQIDSVSNRVSGSGVVYDGAGNLHEFNGHVYTNDAMNMPIRDQIGADGPAKEFLYTADDERIATYGSGSWNWTVRDVSGKVLREFTSQDGPGGPGTAATWQWSRDNVFRDGLLLATRHVADGNEVTYHYHLDHLGTPRRITDQDDRTVGYHDYYAFGPETPGGVTESHATPLQYTGHERDKWGDTQGLDTLDYMHARYYSPVVGRFLSVDPINSAKPSKPQSWNKYTYAQNSPFSMFDPDGRASEYAIIRVTVNVYYDMNTVDNRTAGVFGGPPLRALNEQGIERARNLFSHLGIALDVRRQDVGMMTEKGWTGLAIKKGDDFVLAKNVAKESTGIDVFVTAGLSYTGRTLGEGGPSLVGNMGDTRTFMDEVAHALGNVTEVFIPFFSNAMTDITLLTHEWTFNRGKHPQDQVFTNAVRSSAEAQGCVVGTPGCQ